MKLSRTALTSFCIKVIFVLMPHFIALHLAHKWAAHVVLLATH